MLSGRPRFALEQGSLCGRVALLSFVPRNWLKALLAVVLGNVVYFLLLMPRLPPAGRHYPNRLDWGLVVDFWVCIAMYGLIDRLYTKLRSRAGRLR